MNSIIGIDPGKGGGVAIVYFGKKTKKWVAHKCPKTIKEMVVLLKMFKHASPNTKCFIESVHAFPTDGRSSAFKFGMNYGIWQGILSAVGIETEFVTPQKWQKHFGDLPKNKQDRKNKLKEIASKKSKLKATLSTADAILIAVYGYDYENL
tara:strand:- start:542 stop:994 length:453 start_codon:yes stop_codon:yes gene_type:complete